MTPALRELLESPTILKCGVGINGDLHKLSLDLNIQLQGVLDVNVEANQRVQPGGCKLVEWTSFTLAEQCERLLKRRLPKPQQLRCGNWEQVPLSQEQQHYAALDAFASLLVGRAVLKLPLLASHVAPAIGRVVCE